MNLHPGILGGTGGFPVLANNKYIIVGDSRTSTCSEVATLSSVTQNSAGGWLGWLASKIGNAGECVGNFGINTETIQGAQLRRTAQGIGSGVSPTWRAEYAVNAPASTAALAIFLIGVNNSSENIATCGPRYDALFGAEIDAGRVVAICNEIPNNNESGWGANNLARRDYLDSWPDSSTALTVGQKATYRAKRIIINTYDALAATPRSLFGKAGTYTNTSPLLHPSTRGHRILGDVIGVAVGNLYTQNGLLARNSLPAVGASDSIFGTTLIDMTGGTTAITAANGESAGAGGSNMDGSGGVGVSGMLPTPGGGGRTVTLTRSANLQTALNGAQDGTYQLNVTSSVVSVNGRNNIRLAINSNGKLLPATGTLQLTLIYQLQINQAATQALNLNSKTMSTISRLAFGANQTGLTSCGVYQNVTGPSYNPGANFTLYDAFNIYGDIAADDAFDRNVMTLTPLALPSNFDAVVGTRTFIAQVSFRLTNGVAIDTTIDVAALGIYPNR